MAIISTMNNNSSKSVVNNRKRKNKELSKEDEEIKQIIFQADNPFKLVSDLEEIINSKIKSASDMKNIHRRMRSLYNKASSLINEQREQRFGIKPRLRAIRRTQQQQQQRREEGNNTSINILMDNINDMDYRLPSNNNVAKEVDDLAGLMDKQLRISPMMEQQTPLRYDGVGGVVIDGLKRRVVSVIEDDERPAAKRQRRSLYLKPSMLSS